jgi:hypothetical protein
LRSCVAYKYNKWNLSIHCILRNNKTASKNRSIINLVFHPTRECPKLIKSNTRLRMNMQGKPSKSICS